MNLHSYFKNARGIGILATSDSDGMVDIAVYAKPEVVDESTIAFVMKERLSHQNLKSNPHAAYMFIEKGDGYSGKRLYLTKIREETNKSLVEKFIEKQPQISDPNEDSNKYLVLFQVENIWPLVGQK
ncbi:MAG: pyridoxamine 5'-phosphate oxidase family protein [Sedimentisphaerales bacterium]|nr:pyridoxamine 5'-phosphate oxidase family protein [Sedimentisphaerales bacterium]